MISEDRINVHNKYFYIHFVLLIRNYQYLHVSLILEHFAVILKSLVRLLCRAKVFLDIIKYYSCEQSVIQGVPHYTMGLLIKIVKTLCYLS